MEKQTLLSTPNDNGNVGKQKKGYPPKLYVAVSTAILLLGLVFYGGEYWGSHRALGVGTTDDDDVIPIGGTCDWLRTNPDPICATPPGLDHGVCLGAGGRNSVSCQSGQPGSWCGVTDDCVIQTGLTPPHAVCRKKKCQQ